MIKNGCKSGRKVVPQDSKSDLPLAANFPKMLRKILTYISEKVNIATCLRHT